jgi:hypothetical protein
MQWVPKLELGNQERGWRLGTRSGAGAWEPAVCRSLGHAGTRAWLFAPGAKQGIGPISSQKGEIKFIPPLFQRCIGYGVFRQGETDGLSPAFAPSVDRMACRGIGHGVEPPAFLRDQAQPVADGRADEHGVTLLDGPGQ